jgi:hypothetical protein
MWGPYDCAIRLLRYRARRNCHALEHSNWDQLPRDRRALCCSSVYNIRLLDQMLAIVAGATLISYMIYTAYAEVEAKLGTRYLYLTVLFVAFGILRYLYLIDARNEGDDPARLLIRDMPLLLTVLLWISADKIVALVLGCAPRFLEINKCWNNCPAALISIRAQFSGVQRAGLWRLGDRHHLPTSAP